MGEVIKVSCPSCQTEWECFIGCGLQHGDLNRIADIDAYSENDKREIKEYAMRTEMPLFDFHFQLSYCTHCNSIESVPVLHINEKDTDYIGVCEKCGEETKLIKSVSRMKCPVCRKEFLRSENVGLWD